MLVPEISLTPQTVGRFAARFQGDVAVLHSGLTQAQRGRQWHELLQRHTKIVDPSAESLWLGVRIERKLGEKVAENSYANQLRRRFPASREFQFLQRGEYD